MISLRVSIISILSYLAGGFAAGAADVALTYSYDYNNLTATVTGVSGGMSAARGNLVIPSTITRDDKTYTVKAIMNSAFSSCRGFTGTLTIPESVTIIGESAFAGCSGLTGNLVIPESVTAIGDGAFYGCKSFTGDLTVPTAITTIRYKTFNGCSGFTRLIIPETVTNIGPEAFYGCSGLSGELIIPESVTSIGSDAFYQCSGFTGHLTIPASVKTIGSGAFQKCWGFTGLTIPESVTKIENSVFSACFGLKGNLIIPESVTSIGDDAFNNCWNLSGDLVIPSSVTEIGSRAFYECEGFIGNLVLPESLVTIGAHAFRYCPGLNGTLKIPGSVTTIGDYAFNGCVSFTELIIPESVKTLGMYAFSGCEDLLGDLVLPNSVTNIGDGAFSNCTGFRGSLKLPESVVTIGDNAFKGCNRLTGNLVLPATLRTIGEAAFSECTGLTGNLIIPESVETIGNRAFDRCTGFTGSLVIPNSVTSIGTGAFWHCTGLKGSLTISESASSIGENAFAGCSGFNSVTSLNPVPPQCDGDIGLSKLTLEVPRESFKVYETTSPWSTCYPILPFNGVFVNEIIYEIIKNDGENGEDTALVFGGNPDNDGALAIIGEVENEGKKYPVTRIDEGAFKDRQSIRKVTIPASVASIGDEAFSGCGKLVEVIAEDGDKTLEFGTDVFKNAPVATLYLGRNTSGSPFAEVADLVTLTLGDKVTEIGPGDFGGCNSITNIFALNTIPPTLPDDGFSQDVYDNAVLKVPDDGIFDYILADGWKKFLNIIGEYAVIPDGITMEPAEIQLIEEESAQLGVTVSPENATDKTVKWITSDAEVAIVTADGLVTAVKPGEAIITAATRNMLTAVSRVKVLPKPDASGISLNIVAVEIVETETLQL
ncbi:MAG: leucine-rich repeat protein, partial [Paramuribaculum sp.]|nr:leucine-rich repeat protein [Paramuribaculum sp.]